MCTAKPIDSSELRIPWLQHGIGNIDTVNRFRRSGPVYILVKLSVSSAGQAAPGTRRQSERPASCSCYHEDTVSVMNLSTVGPSKAGGCEMDSSGSGEGPVVRSCQHGNEPSGSIRGRRISRVDERLSASRSAVFLITATCSLRDGFQNF
jgi:hypothetical protein